MQQPRSSQSTGGNRCVEYLIDSEDVTLMYKSLIEHSIALSVCLQDSELLLA